MRWLIVCLSFAGLTHFACDRKDSEPPRKSRPKLVQTLQQNQDSAPERCAPETVSARNEAMALARAGETLKAETAFLEHVVAMEKKYGENSREHAWAQFNLASLYLVLGQPAKAIEAMRAATRVQVGDDEEAEKDRLTFLMNLGDFFAHQGNHEEAVKAHRESVEGRAELFGTKMDSYAYGLEPLAVSLFETGQHEEALRHAKTCIDIFLAQYHPRVTTAMAQHAWILAHDTAPQGLFARADDLPKALIPDLVGAALARVSPEKTEPARRMLESLLAIVRNRLGREHRMSINLIIALSNIENQAGEVARSVERLREVAKIGEELKRFDLIIEALTGIARTLEDEEQPEAALKAYKEAKTRAADSKERLFEWDCAYHLALYLVDLKKHDDARREFELAMQCAKSAEDEQIVARTRAAYGIYLQHHGETETAQKLLKSALEKLDPNSMTAMYCRSHHAANQSGVTCPCGGAINNAMYLAIKNYVVSHTPEGLVEDIHLEDGVAKVRYSRKPTQAEKTEVQRVLEHARANLGRRIQNDSHSVYEQVRAKQRSIAG